MVLTRNMAAAEEARAETDGYLAGLEVRSDADTDLEVTIRSHQWSEADSIPFDSDPPSRRPYVNTHSENRLAAVEDAMHGMNGKFDQLLRLLPSGTQHATHEQFSAGGAPPPSQYYQVQHTGQRQPAPRPTPLQDPSLVGHTHHPQTASHTGTPSEARATTSM